MISEEQFQRLLAALTHSTPATDPAKKFDTLAGRIDPEADLTFEAWYRRHADIFTVDAKSLDEATRVRLLLHKLDAPSYEKYVNYILPQTPQEVKFDDAISTLKDLFGPQQSLFSTRYTCLKLTKDPKDDFATYAGRVNRECAKFKLAECNENQFKCLIFVCGLQSSEDAFIRLKLLDKIESDPNCTIQILAEECKRLLNLRHDTKMIENGSPVVHSVKQFLPSRQGQQKVNSKTNAQATHPEPTVPDKPLDINTTMERQFNRKHGARRRTFKVGDPVLVKTYQGQQRWTNGQVLRRLGLVLYEVLVGKEKWIRHTNQLRIRFGEGDHNATDDMDTLFEMFDLKRAQSPIHSSTSLTDNDEESTTLTAQNVPQLRRSTRTRRAPRRLVIDPVQKSYRTRGTNS
ncbi:hypothetical protein ANCCEY_05375 [Ancylostoma ceylanicum]|uniref:DUF7083 domain-containing protein n=1 Tax=Ancylostoma ceylanicum TaxID=53326 RepID=A0A0D6LUH5_9BILA|nr:hypothetical protein ANCCEY_05375 [Ancylostoma ceylanicum]